MLVALLRRLFESDHNGVAAEQSALLEGCEPG